MASSTPQPTQGLIGASSRVQYWSRFSDGQYMRGRLCPDKHCRKRFLLFVLGMLVPNLALCLTLLLGQFHAMLIALRTDARDKAKAFERLRWGRPEPGRKTLLHRRHAWSGSKLLSRTFDFGEYFCSCCSVVRPLRDEKHGTAPCRAVICHWRETGAVQDAEGRPMFRT